MVIRDKNNFTCSICRKEKPIEYLKGSLQNDEELQRLLDERRQLAQQKTLLDIKEADALQGKSDMSGIEQARKKLDIWLKGVATRIKNFSGLLVCISDWNKGRRDALQSRGEKIEFTCSWCRREVSGKKYWCHVVNGLDKDINPWIAVELCKLCWLNEVVPNDKVNYCPRLGSEGDQDWSTKDEKFDCQCKVAGKMSKDREGGYF